MSVTGKSDVRNHLSRRYHKEIHLCQSASHPDATSFSMTEPASSNAKPVDFEKDFSGEHSSSGPALVPGNPLTDLIRPQAPAASKSART